MESKLSVIYKESREALAELYEWEEAGSIANILFEDLLGISRIDRMTRPDAMISDEDFQKIEDAMVRLKHMEPIQHIVGKAFFFNHFFRVTPDTLIPRPETEELVDWILEEKLIGKKVLDVGAGSGCIGISLKLARPLCEVTLLDFSEAALTVCGENAANLRADIDIIHSNILEDELHEQYDIIVSNPPYVPFTDRKEMHENVLNYEPVSALFVANDSPLLFYDRIAFLATKFLKDCGILFFEIHERFGDETVLLLKDFGFENVELRKDHQGKDRMIRALWKANTNGNCI